MSTLLNNGLPNNYEYLIQCAQVYVEAVGLM